MAHPFTPFGYIRFRLGVSQKGAAALVGISRVTWQRWESGQQEPVYSQLRALRDAAKLHLNGSWNDSWLFEVPGEGGS